MARVYSGPDSDIVLQYAKIMGVIIVLIGVVGLLLGDRSLFNILNIDLAEDIIHLVTGGLMAWVGFNGNKGLARSIVSGLGIVYLLIGVLGFVAPNLFGLLPHGYSLFDTSST